MDMDSLQFSITENLFNDFSNEYISLNNFKISRVFAIFNVFILLCTLIYTRLCNKNSRYFKNTSRILKFLTLLQVVYFIVSSLYYLDVSQKIYDVYLERLQGLDIYKVGSQDFKQGLLNNLNETRYFHQRNIMKNTPVLIWSLFPLLLIFIFTSINFHTVSYGYLNNFKYLRYFPFLTAGVSLVFFLISLIEMFEKSNLSYSFLSVYSSEHNLIYFCEYIYLLISLISGASIFNKMSNLVTVD